MKLTKKDNFMGTKDIQFEIDNKTLSFIFAGTGDLHWIINNKKVKEYNKNQNESFIITKENYNVYSLFLKLYDDIKNINIFDKENCKENIDEYREFNISNYNELFHGNTITWYSDETGHDVANILTIKKKTDTFVINIKTQPYIKGYEPENNFPGMLGIRIRNSGSRYNPFNIIFMRMYNEMQKVDDINDQYHQISIEEYLYANEKKLQLKKRD